MKQHLELSGSYLIVFFAVWVYGGMKDAFYFLLGWFVCDLVGDLIEAYRNMEKD